MSRPESAGLCGPRLKHIDRFLQQKYLDSGKLPCALTLVERNGEVAHLSTLGRLLSAIIAVIIWPLLLFGIDVRIS